MLLRFLVLIMAIGCAASTEGFVSDSGFGEVHICLICSNAISRHKDGQCPGAVKLARDLARSAGNLKNKFHSIQLPGAMSGRPQLGTAQAVLDRFRLGSPIRVVVIGNSIGCGYDATNLENITEDDNDRIALVDREATASHINGWVQRLRDYVVQVNSSSAVLNLSGNGWNTNNHMETQPTSGEGYNAARNGTFGIIDAMAVKPDMVLLPLQVNDRSYAISTFVNNTTAIISSLRARGIVPVIVMENYATGADTVIARAGTLADELSVAKIDLNTTIAWTSHLAGSGTPWLTDNTHPNNDGHTQLYNGVKNWFDNASNQP